MKLFIKIVDAILTIILVLATVICLVGAQNYKATGLSKFGKFTLIQVVSSSMTDSDILVGDVQLVEACDVYGVGDIIAYTYNNTIIYHEIISVDDTGNFITKGSSNRTADPHKVSMEQIIGKRKTALNFKFLVSLPFKLTLVFSLYTIIMLSYTLDMIHFLHEKLKTTKK